MKMYAILPTLALATAAFGAVTPEISLDERSLARRSLSGQATFYGGNVQGGACSFSTYTLPSGLMGTALSSSNWDDSAECGGCVNVHYGGKSITAMVSYCIRQEFHPTRTNPNELAQFVVVSMLNSWCRS